MGFAARRDAAQASPAPARTAHGQPPLDDASPQDDRARSRARRVRAVRISTKPVPSAIANPTSGRRAASCKTSQFARTETRDRVDDGFAIDKSEGRGCRRLRDALDAKPGCPPCARTGAPTTPEARLRASVCALTTTHRRRANRSRSGSDHDGSLTQRNDLDRLVGTNVTAALSPRQLRDRGSRFS
jgi:hypothetical protein